MKKYMHDMEYSGWLEDQADLCGVDISDRVVDNKLHSDKGKNSMVVTTMRYKVTFGPKKEQDRESRVFEVETEASDFFRMKDEQGFHVDCDQIVTVTTTTRLSRAEAMKRQKR